MDAVFDSPRLTAARPTREGKVSGGRVASIDLLKALAIFGVICIHILPFHEASQPLAAAINDVARGGVPYFFIVSGYFFARSVYGGAPNGEMLLRTVNRLLLIFVVASLVYLFEPDFRAALPHRSFSELVAGRLDASASHPLELLLEGLAPQLWFLVSLAMALALFSAFAALGLDRWFLWLAIPLYEFGVLGGAYAGTPIGFHVAFNTRDGPFFATVFVAVGAWLARSGYRPRLGLALALIASGLVLHAFEAYFLSHGYGASPFGVDFVHGTALYGTGLAFLAFACPSFGAGSRLAGWGRLTLGIYVIHYFIVDLLRGLAPWFPTLSWQVVFPLSVFFLSVALTQLMAGVPVLRRVVT